VAGALNGHCADRAPRSAAPTPDQWTTCLRGPEEPRRVCIRGGVFLWAHASGKPSGAGGVFPKIEQFVMAITSAEAAIWHYRCPQAGLNTACRGRAREITMRKIHLFAIAAAVIVTGVGVWAASTTDARAPVSMQGVEPLQLMMNAKGLPTAEAYDHGFVFH
jgi:hypothetical protein